MKELICIVCPKGCRLRVDEKNAFEVTGNACERGIAYGKEECTEPKRVVTSTIAVHGAQQTRTSVKTSAQIPKQLVLNAVKALDDTVLNAPVKIGDIAVKNVCDTGVDFVVTRGVE